LAEATLKIMKRRHFIAAIQIIHLVALHAAETPPAAQVGGGAIVTIHPLCTDITHDSPNPTVLGCGLARMKNGGVMTVYFTPTGAYSKPGASRR
jgi:hypothetical protein